MISDEENELINFLLKNLFKILDINCVSTAPCDLNSEKFVKNRDNAIKNQSYQRIDIMKQDNWDLFRPIVLCCHVILQFL